MILGADADLEPLLERIGDAYYVWLGEASHGTHDADTPADVLDVQLGNFVVGQPGCGATTKLPSWPTGCVSTTAERRKRLVITASMYSVCGNRWRRPSGVAATARP
ncbi:hypothetical protein SAMN05216167_102682 [Spirosoma endophyticum]|uniref:Uncharacterized protein n=2 Tax=Spirosoma endophyticum TaxID=662367 RepID=A0A1I1MS91_9BACT|nr:hypothetical protein SAMN05216167_102682 [Spirosoma endophyticum]